MAGVTYNVYRGLRSDGSDGVKLNAAPVMATSYLDTDIEPATTFYYAVTGISREGTEGNKSLVVKVGGKAV